ncbi:hypothetical protein ACO0LI_26355 [Undibacterium sp. Tian12W]
MLVIIYQKLSMSSTLYIGLKFKLENEKGLQKNISASLVSGS